MAEPLPARRAGEPDWSGARRLREPDLDELEFVAIDPRTDVEGVVEAAGGIRRMWLKLEMFCPFGILATSVSRSSLLLVSRLARLKLRMIGEGSRTVPVE